MYSLDNQFQPIPEFNRQRVESAVSFKDWVILIGLAILVIGYGSGLISYGFANLWFSFQPATLLLSVGTLVIAAGFRFSILRNIGSTILVIICVCRSLDSYVRPVPEILESGFRVMLGTTVFALIASVIVDFKYRKILVWIASGAILTISVSFNLWEWRNPGFFSLVMGRAAGIF
jgi:hypothetical protein